DRGTRPGRKVAILSPATRLPLPWILQRRLETIESIVQAHQREVLLGALRDDRLEPRQTLIPPVAEQLGVERTHDQPAPGQALAVAAQALAGAGDEVRRVLTRASERQLVVIRLAVVAPGIVMVNRVAVIVAVSAVRGIAGIAPHQRHGGAIDGP